MPPPLWMHVTVDASHESTAAPPNGLLTVNGTVPGRHAIGAAVALGTKGEVQRSVAAAPDGSSCHTPLTTVGGGTPQPNGFVFGL